EIKLVHAARNYMVRASICSVFIQVKPIWSGSFCRDSTPNGRDRPPSLGSAIHGFFSWKAVSDLPEPQTLWNSATKNCFESARTKALRGHLSTLCAKTHGHGA